jgi:hypothetical protein
MRTLLSVLSPIPLTSKEQLAISVQTRAEPLITKGPTSVNSPMTWEKSATLHTLGVSRDPQRLYTPGVPIVAIPK